MSNVVEPQAPVGQDDKHPAEQKQQQQDFTRWSYNPAAESCRDQQPGGCKNCGDCQHDATTPAWAQTATAEPSPNAMVNLIRLLVGQKVITAEAGEALLAQAQSEADAAQAKLAVGSIAAWGWFQDACHQQQEHEAQPTEQHQPAKNPRPTTLR